MISSSKLSEESDDSTGGQVRVSDGENFTDNCSMARQKNVTLLQNPVIKVISWDITRYQGNICLHITDFVTVKNTVNYPLVGNPVLLKDLPEKMEGKTTFENMEKDGVLIPGSNVSSLVLRIMNNMRNHYVSHAQTTQTRPESKHQRQVWTKI